MFRHSIKIREESHEADVVAVFCDLRDFTRKSFDARLGSSGLTKIAAFLYAHIQKNLSRVASAVAPLYKPAGDGLMIIYELPQQVADARSTANRIVSSLLKTHDSFEIPAGLVGGKIESRMGIGVARGAATCVQMQSGGSPSEKADDYFGYVVNLAAKLQNFARPSGVIIDAKGLRELLRKETIDRFSIETREISSETDLPVFVYGRVRDATSVDPSHPPGGYASGIRPWNLLDIFNEASSIVLAVHRTSLVKAGLKPSNARLITAEQKVSRIIQTIANPRNQFLFPRHQVENKPRYKQVIPYPIFRCEGRVFAYTRGPGRTEGRIEESRSLGVGGHVRAIDSTALQREFSGVHALPGHNFFDKVALLGGSYQWKRRGIAWDEGATVDRSHIGIVYVVDLTKRSDLKVTDRTSIVNPEWRLPSRLNAEEFTPWSKICLRSGILDD